MLLNKVVIVLYGPAGISYYAHFIDLFNIFIFLPQQGLNKGLVKLLSETPQSTRSFNQAQQLVYYLWGGICLVIVILQLLNSQYLKLFIELPFYQLPAWWGVFLISTLLFSKQVLWVGLIQAKEDFKKHALLGILGTVLGLMLFYLLSRYGIQWASLGFIAGLALSLYPTQKYGEQYLISTPTIANNTLLTSIKRFLPFILFALAGIFTNNVMYLVRSFSLVHLGAVETAYWQVPFTFSKYISIAFTSIVLLVFYPKIAKLVKEPPLFYHFLWKFSSLIVVIIISGLSIFYFLRKSFVLLFFDESVTAALELFSIHLIGDFFMLFSYMGVYALLALGRVKLLIIQQIFAGIAQAGWIYFLYPTEGIMAFPESHLVMKLVGAVIIWSGLIFHWRNSRKGTVNQ